MPPGLSKMAGPPPRGNESVRIFGRYGLNAAGQQQHGADSDKRSHSLGLAAPVVMLRYQWLSLCPGDAASSHRTRSKIVDVEKKYAVWDSLSPPVVFAIRGGVAIDAAMGIRTPVVGVKGRHDWPDYTIAAIEPTSFVWKKDIGCDGGVQSIGVPDCSVADLNAEINWRVTGPGRPEPMERPSITTIGPTSAAVPVTKTSSAE